jgi:hypothetical protein
VWPLLRLYIEDRWEKLVSKSVHDFKLTDWLTAKCLLALASTLILGSKSSRTHDHILMSDGSWSLWNLQLTLHDSQSRERVKYGFKSRETRKQEWLLARASSNLRDWLTELFSHESEVDSWKSETWVDGWESLVALLDAATKQQLVKT